LSKIKGQQPLNPKEVETALNETLNEYGIKFFPGRGVNWRNTKYVTNPAAQKEMEGAIQTIRTWGDYSPLGVDNLKQALDNLWKRSQPEASGFVKALRNRVKDVLSNNIPEYKEMVGQYKTSTEEINEITKDLSLGDLNTKKQALQKLLGAMKRDDQFSLDLISRVDRPKGIDFRAALAGAQMQPYVPQSLVGKMGGVYELLKGIGNISFGDVLAISASSPKLVGEFLNVFGKVARPGMKLMKYAPPATQALIQKEETD
jgi:hypothetical protein